jgi:hypothetical protein
MKVEFRMRNKLKGVTRFERRAFLLGIVLLVGLATLGLTGLASADQIGPNPTVQLVDNLSVSCESPVPSAIDAGQLGDTLTVSTEDPVDFVLVKSAPNAEVTAQFDTTSTSGQITSTKNITSYVVWTCPTTTS